MVTNQPAFLKKDNLKMCCSRKDGTRYQRGNVFHVHEKLGLFSSVYVDYV